MLPYDYFESRPPRRTDDGIQARSRRGDFAEHWWAERWLKSLEQITNAGRLRRGRSYARSGQVLSIEESQGRIRARVQGSRATPYRVDIRLEPLSDDQWQAVLDALAERAIFTAQLLAGEMPNDIEEAFAAAGVSLLPAASADLETSCTCPDWANPCKHVAAVHYILAEQFDQDPFLIFRLRGRTQAQIMAALAEKRQTHAAAAVAEAAVPYAPAEQTPPLEESLAAFWRMAQPLDHFLAAIQAPPQPYPILRRLGPPTFAPALEQSLRLVYDAMTQEALAAAFRDDSADAASDEQEESA